MNISKSKINSLNSAERLQVAIDVLQEQYDSLKSEGAKWSEELYTGVDWLGVLLAVEKRK